MVRYIKPKVEAEKLSDRELDALIDYLRGQAQELDQLLIDLAGERAKRTMQAIF